MASEGDPKIRRIAIVLQSMDADTVRRLLSQFPEEVARAIRRAFSNLGTVTLAERAAAAQELQNLLGKTANASSDAGPAAQVLGQGDAIQDSVQFSMEARHAASAHSGPATLASAPDPETIARMSGRSWLSVPPATLAHILQGERPSVVAAVLHELPVVMATSVLQILPIPAASEAMAAMPHLHRSDPAFMNELLDQIWAKSDEALRNDQKTHLGMERLRAIMAQAPEDHKSLWTAALGHIDPALPSALGWRGTTSETDAKPSASTPIAPALKVYAPPESAPQDPPKEPFPYQSLVDLMKLDDVDFVAVLHAAEPENVLLALAGSERILLNRVERLMPKKDRSRFRQRINRLNDVSLREIDRAREAILDRANAMHSEGRIGTRTTTSFSAAA